MPILITHILLDAPIVIEDSQLDISDDEPSSLSDLLSGHFTMRKNNRASEPSSDMNIIGGSDVSIAAGLIDIEQPSKDTAAKAPLSDSAVIPGNPTAAARG